MKMNRKVEFLAVILFAISSILIVLGMLAFMNTSGIFAYVSLSLSIIVAVATILSIYTGALDKIIDTIIKK